MPTNVGPYAAIAGHGILFTDFNTGQLWFADDAGGRVIYSGAAWYYASEVTAAVGDVAFVAALKLTPQGESFNYSSSVLSITFGASGNPVVNEIFDTPNLVDNRSLTVFGGGVAFVASSPTNGAPSLYWYDPSTNQLRTLLNSSSISSLQYLTVGDAGDGTQNLFFIENSSGLAILKKLNSSQLSTASPTIDFIETFSEVTHPLVRVDGQLLIVDSQIIAGDPRNQLYLNDGTATGTREIGQPFIGYLTNPVVLGHSFYFGFQPVNSGQVTSTTLTAQLWKVDAVTGAVSDVADFLGPGAVYGLSEFTVGGGKVYFNVGADDESISLKSYDPATGVSSVVGKPNNEYVNPSGLSYFDGALYFTAESVALPDPFGRRSYQPWVLGPAPPGTHPSLQGDYNHDGSVDAADYIIWRKTLNTQDKYDEWRANFGTTSGSGNGAASTLTGATISNGQIDVSVVNQLVNNSSSRNSSDDTHVTITQSAETAFSEFGLVAPSLAAFRNARSSQPTTAIGGHNATLELSRWNDLLLGSTQQPIMPKLQRWYNFDFDGVSNNETWSDSDEVSPSTIEEAFAVLAAKQEWSRLDR
jgi:hypothetical protein